MAMKVLIADEEETVRKHVSGILQTEGYDVTVTGNGLEAHKRLKTERFDVLITDIKMPGMNGLELLEKAKENSPNTDVIIITGLGSIGSAVEAMKKGAYDYIPKPFELDELLLKMRQLHDQKQLQKENVALRSFLDLQKEFTVIAESESMKRILGVIHNLQTSDAAVLLTGESGVGKNLLAKIIHFSSPRKDEPFLSINCATFTEELLASELFGHEKGAFTGAVTQKQGLMEIAHGGTLYLDEIAEMPPNLQAKLLKVIEELEFFRVGGVKPIKVNIRFIAATNTNITQAIEKGTFRRDLYYRLNVMEINIPPLRERKKDIAPLSNFFLKKHLTDYRKNIKGFTKDAMHILKNYSFPGNVRELENIIERAIILEKSSYLTADSLPKTIAMFQIETLEPTNIKSLEEISNEYVRSVVELLGGNKAEAARLLGISRTSLWRMLKEE